MQANERTRKQINEEAVKRETNKKKPQLVHFCTLSFDRYTFPPFSTVFTILVTYTNTVPCSIKRVTFWMQNVGLWRFVCFHLDLVKALHTIHSYSYILAWVYGSMCMLLLLYLKHVEDAGFIQHLIKYKKKIFEEENRQIHKFFSLRFEVCVVCVG